MVIRPSRFNIYLLLAVVLIVVVGCSTLSSRSKKQIATLRVHLESPHNPSGMTEVVSVIRASPMSINIESQPFLTESDLTAAKLIAGNEEFFLQLQLNQQGQRLLEQYSSANPQRRIVIRSQFRLGTNVFDRWLAAPLVTRRISDGIIAFSPDADREEAEALVAGLNKAAEYEPPKADKVKTDKASGGKK